MKRFIVVTLVVGLAAASVWSSSSVVPPAPNGITMPDGWRDWRVIAVSRRADKHQVRAILGNDVAIAAARAGRTNPWPDGAIMAKVAWKEKEHENFPGAFVPADFVQVEFIVKNKAKYPDTGGWGFARWVGLKLKPYGQDAHFVNECFACHTPMAANDYVFTRPARFP
jgi:hypothetical protein